MKSRVGLPIAGAVLVAALVAIWVHCRDQSPTAVSGAADSDDGDGGGAAGRHGGGAADSLDVPPWFGQPGLPARRIAGRVLGDGGAPVAGATVRLFSDLVAADVQAEQVATTDAAGHFDLGTRAAGEYIVTATAEGRAPGSRLVDLRDPTARPPADDLVIRLWPCTAILYGTVRDASGGVVAEAQVRVFTDEAEAVAVTGADGGYQVCVREGGGDAVVRAEGYAQATVAILARGNRSRQDFDLAPAATIVGRVVRDGDRAAVAGAYISVNRADARDPTSDYLAGKSGADGRFTIEGAAPGRYRVSASTDTLWGESVDVVVGLGQKSEEVLCLVYPAFRLAGRVLSDGKPVAGALVIADADATEGRGAAVSQEDGRFIIAGLPPGEYTIHTPGHHLIAPELVTLKGADRDITVEVSALVTLRGHVTRGGAPVEDATIWSGEASTTSDAAGAFELRGVVEGPYEVHAQSDHDGAFAEPVKGSAEAGAVVEGIAIELDLAASISGRVLDAAGAPVAEAAVTFVRDSGDDFGYAVSAADGSFTARALGGGGEYDVDVRRAPRYPRAFHPAHGDSFPRVRVPDGKSHVEGVELVVDAATAVISGKVVRESGSPVADALVVAAGNYDFPPGYDAFDFDDFSARSRADGSFKIEGLAAGEYDVSARVGEGVDATAKGVATGTSNLILRLADTGAIEASLEGFGPRARVEAYLVGGERTYSGVVDDAGGGVRARIADVGAGRYLVIATGAAQVASASTTVKPGQTAHVTLRAAGTAAVDGRVVDFHTGAAVTNVTCGWRRTVGSDQETFDTASPTAVRVDEQGRFHLEVPAGAVEVQCSNYASLWSDDVTISWPRVEVAAGKTVSVDVYQVRRQGRERVDIGIYFGDVFGPPAVDMLAEGSVAAAAGVREGDLVVAVAGRDTTHLHAMGVEFLIDNLAGRPVPLRLQRSGAVLEITVAAPEPTTEDDTGPPSDL